MKGQMFVVAGVFILIGLVILFNMFGTHIIAEERQFLETRILDRTMKNVAGELKRVIGLSTMGNVVAFSRDYMSSASNYYRSDTGAKIFYSIIFVNGTTQRISVLSGNYLGDEISLEMNITNSTPGGNISIIKDGMSSLSEFAPNSNGTLSINLTYKIGNDVVTERLYANVSSKNFVLGFFDLSLGEDDFFVRTKDTYARTW